MKFDSNHELIIFNDNLQTIRLLNSEIARIEIKLKHINIAQCWLRQEVQNGHLIVDYVPTAQMVADDFIKILSLQKHKIFISQLGLMNCKKAIVRLNEKK